MRVLLDTHVLLWAASAPERLGAAQQVVLDADQRLVSAASTWELAIKAGLGKIHVGMAVGPWVERAVRELRGEHLDVTSAHAAAVEQMPPVHRDPFDRLLVAQAAEQEAVLLTADRILLEYGGAVRLVG